MRSLKGGIPRVWRKHKGAEAVAYRRVADALVTRYGPLDFMSMRLVREISLLTLELGRIHTEAAEIRAGKKKQTRQLARLRRQSMGARSQLMTLERHLATLGKADPPDFATELAKQGRAILTRGDEHDEQDEGRHASDQETP